MDELLAALHTKSQTKRCAGCHVCKLQQSSMEVWTVTANGIGNVLCLLWLKSFCIKKGGKTILIQQMVLKNKRSPFEIAVYWHFVIHNNNNYNNNNDNDINYL